MLVATARAVLSVFIIVLFVRLVLDLVQSVSPQWRPRGAMLWVAEVTYTVTDPPVKFVRRFVPPLRLGPVMLDLSFLILLFSAQMLQRLLLLVA
ncbi:MAG: YggT family protein [Actinobacteria bacterium]|nr:YggT family protein [Actinomycetota bacterium]